MYIVFLVEYMKISFVIDKTSVSAVHVISFSFNFVNCEI